MDGGSITIPPSASEAQFQLEYSRLALQIHLFRDVKFNSFLTFVVLQSDTLGSSKQLVAMSSENTGSLDYDSDGDEEARLIANPTIPDASPLLFELAAGDFPTYFSERGGRLFHAHASSLYPLPVDTPEQQVNIFFDPISS